MPVPTAREEALQPGAESESGGLAGRPYRRPRAVGRASGLWIGAALLAATSASAEGQPLGGLFPPPIEREQVNAFVGSGPERCVSTVPPAKVCTWRVEAGTPAQQRLARELDGEQPIRLVCDIGGGLEGRCTAHSGTYARPGRIRPSDLDDVRDRETALAAIESARTLGALTHLLGGAPDELAQRNASEFVCVWRADPGSTAHRVVGEAAATTYSARLICRLPFDGSAREEDSCRAQPTDE